MGLQISGTQLQILEAAAKVSFTKGIAKLFENPPSELAGSPSMGYLRRSNVI
jgi:hypothetical protein